MLFIWLWVWVKIREKRGVKEKKITSAVVLYCRSIHVYVSSQVLRWISAMPVFRNDSIAACASCFFATFFFRMPKNNNFQHDYGGEPSILWRCWRENSSDEQRHKWKCLLVSFGPRSVDTRGFPFVMSPPHPIFISIIIETSERKCKANPKFRRNVPPFPRLFFRRCP